MDNPMIDYKVLCEAKEEQMKQLKDICEEQEKILSDYENKIKKLKKKNKKLKKDIKQIRNFYFKIFALVYNKNNGCINVGDRMLSTPIIEENKGLFK